MEMATELKRRSTINVDMELIDNACVAYHGKYGRLPQKQDLVKEAVERFLQDLLAEVGYEEATVAGTERKAK